MLSAIQPYGWAFADPLAPHSDQSPTVEKAEPSDRNSDNKKLSPAHCTCCGGRVRRKRAKRVKENPEYVGMCKRVIRRLAERVKEDPEALADLLHLETVIKEAAGNAARGLFHGGFSWGEIGKRLGMTRQACRQRWGDRS